MSPIKLCCCLIYLYRCIKQQQLSPGVKTVPSNHLHLHKVSYYMYVCNKPCFSRHNLFCTCEYSYKCKCTCMYQVNFRVNCTISKKKKFDQVNREICFTDYLWLIKVVIIISILISEFRRSWQRLHWILRPTAGKPLWLSPRCSVVLSENQTSAGLITWKSLIRWQGCR